MKAVSGFSFAECIMWAMNAIQKLSSLQDRKRKSEGYDSQGNQSADGQVDKTLYKVWMMARASIIPRLNSRYPRNMVS